MPAGSSKVKRRIWPIGLQLSIAVTFALALSGTSMWALWKGLGSPPLLIGAPGSLSSSERLDLTKISLSIVAGVGGIVALVVAYRRQRITEAAHDREERVAIENRAHADRLAEASEYDLSERRITELYTKAADQLGSDKVAVRLAGVYALERLANNMASQRQAIVNVLSAYLRMPPIDAKPPEQVDGGTPADKGGSQEAEVRYSVQQVLMNGLSDTQGSPPWTGVQVNLTGALLGPLSISKADVTSLELDNATVVGELKLRSCKVAERLGLRNGTFCGEAAILDLNATTAVIDWRSSRFLDSLILENVQFMNDVEIAGLTTAGNFRIEGCRAPLRAWFIGGRHQGQFTLRHFTTQILRIEDAQLDGGAIFDSNKLGGVRLQDVQVRKGTVAPQQLPEGFHVNEYDEQFDQLGARIPPYWLDTEGNPTRQLDE